MPDQTAALCRCGHRLSEHAPIASGDTRCLTVDHPAALSSIFDDGRDHGGQDYRYCGCLAFTAADKREVA